MDLSDALAVRPETEGWSASLELAYARQGARTAPVLRRHAGPLRALKGHLPEGPDCWHQVVVHPPGGIAGGDRLAVSVTAQACAHALLTAPGAAKWYRATRPATQAVRLQVDAGACLEWLPMENIFFDDTRAALALDAEVHPEGTLMLLDLNCLGRPAADEAFARGSVALRTRVTRDGVPVFFEQVRLTGGHPMLASRAGLAGAPLFGTLLAASPRLRDADRAAVALATCRAAVPQDVGCTLLDGMLVARWRGARADAGLAALRTAWAALRPLLLDRAACAPRIWST